MDKFVNVGWKLLLMAISLPLIKTFYDYYTEPATGILVTMGVPDDQIAIVGAVPFAFPIAMLVWAIIDLSKPDDDNKDRYDGIR